MKSVNEVGRRALQMINAVAEGQDLTGDQIDKVNRIWTGMYAELDRQDLAPFDPDQIPDPLAELLASLLSYRCSDDFYVTAQDQVALYAKTWDRRTSDSAYRRYRRILGTGIDHDGSREPETNYF